MCIKLKEFFLNVYGSVVFLILNFILGGIYEGCIGEMFVFVIFRLGCRFVKLLLLLVLEKEKGGREK